MLKGSKDFARLFSLKNLRLLRRNLNTTNKKQSGGHHDAHHKPADQGNSSFFSRFMFPEHPKLHQGYLYREAGNLQGAQGTTMARAALTIAWWWVFYKLISEPQNFFGHMPYPDTSKWTDSELGIPTDDQE